MKKLLFCTFILIHTSFIIHANNSKNLQGDNGYIDSLIQTNKSIIAEIDTLKVQVDSLNSNIALISRTSKKQIDLIHENDNKRSILDYDIDWFNLFLAIIALGVACFSAVFDVKGFLASKRTADNVERVSLDVQMAQFNDLTRHLYRNLICTLAFTKKTLDNTSYYPSEEHLLKLKVLPEDIIHLEKYNNNTTIYEKMHELKILLRNYDIEIETALTHLKNGKVNIIHNDLDSLTFKPIYLIKRVSEIRDLMLKQAEGSSFENTASIITSEHIKKLNENDESFNINNYIHLNITNIDDKIDPPYDGLRRSCNILFKYNKERTLMNLTNLFTDNNQIFDTKKYEKYGNALEYICKQNSKFRTFKDNITNLKDFDFNENLFTMITIDSTIEFNKIHMIQS